MKFKPEDIQLYIDQVTDDRKTLLLQFRDRIMRLYPDAVPRISYQIWMFKRKTGWTAVGYRRDGVTLYTGHPRIILEFHASHPEIKTGTGCINFKKDVPWEDVDGIIQYAMEAKKG